MDSQRTLFKKFFNSPSNLTNTNNVANSNDSSSGFNPPKFHFNKKKLGIIQPPKEEVTVYIDEAENEKKVFDKADEFDGFNDYEETVEIIEKPCMIEYFQNAKAKYDLRFQLTDFNEKMTNLLMICDEKRQQVDWLIVGLDERMAEMRSLLDS